MDGRSIIDLLKREFSEDVVLRLSNIIKVTSLDDLVIDHFRTCQLKGIYDCLKEIIFYCEVKKLSEDGCCCSDKFTDVIDGPCPCAIFERNKNKLLCCLQLIESHDDSEIKLFFVDRYLRFLKTK